MLIDQSIERELLSHLATPLSVRRLAINPEQIETYDLPTKPRKEGERRRLDIQETVEAEAEAMPANIMRRLVRNAVEACLPPGALEATRAAEESERFGLQRLGQHIEATGMPVL